MSICLIGFMGSGKTTIGKALCNELHINWVDLDQYIEEKEKRKISMIFKENGEAYFRVLEHNYLKALIHEEGIISTGGGIITTPENRQLLQKTITVYLEYPFEILYQRIEGDETRPLATSYNALKERFETRLSLYESASRITIKCQDKSINEVVQEIATYIEKMA